MKHGASPESTPPDFLTSVLALDRESNSKADLLRLLAAASDQGSRLVVLPFGLPSSLGKPGGVDLGRLAKKFRFHLIAGFRKNQSCTVRIYTPSGGIAGEYNQTHRLPGEAIRLGNELAPISTALGTIGLSVGSDLYFPEIHWSLARQGADILVHLDGDRGANDHSYSVLSPAIRAFDCHRPFLLARPTSSWIKLVHNEEMGISGTPMSGSMILDQNGAILANTGYSQGIASATLRFGQHCRSGENTANLPLSRGLDVWKLYFDDSREKYFGPLCQPISPPKKPRYHKRTVRIAVLSHFFSHQLGKDDRPLFTLLREAGQARPDIILCTEMEQECRPEDRRIAAKLKKMGALAGRFGAYLLVGGIRPSKPGSPQDRSSHAWLWDRSGKLVFESSILLYGQRGRQDVYDTDFGRIAVRLCGDVYAPEIDRLFALKGADIVFNPSMSWGASGEINSQMARVRAMDNGHFIVNAHLAFSDPGQRSQIIDPSGCIVASSAYYENSVLVAEVNLDAKRGVFVPCGKRKIDSGAYLAKYRSRVAYRLVPQQELFEYRRPELYRLLNVDLPDHPYTTRDRGDGRRIPRRH